jgi:biotin carboxylase
VPTVLFLGASVSQHAAMRQARAAGWRVVAVDGDPHAVGFADADTAEAIDFTDVDRVTALARAERIDAVVAISTDRAVPVAAAVAERLGLPGIGAETAYLMTNKARMREHLAARDVPQPAYTILGNHVEPSSGLDVVGVPAVLKPVDSGGQRGLHLISHPDELAPTLPLALAHSRIGEAILESYIEGDELNGIVVVRDGQPILITLSDRLRPPGLGFGVGWIHLYPSRLDAAVLERAGSIASDAVRALGLRNGIAFPQLLVTTNGDVYVVEVAARIPAGQMADLVRFAKGIDLVQIALTQASGAAVPDGMLEAAHDRPIAIRFLTASPGVLPVGEVRSVEGLELARSSPGVLDADLYIQVGETIRPVQVDADRRGYVIATGQTADDALELAQAAALKIRVHTR